MSRGGDTLRREKEAKRKDTPHGAGLIAVGRCEARRARRAASREPVVGPACAFLRGGGGGGHGVGVGGHEPAIRNN
jgi:hypothetical protein